MNRVIALTRLGRARLVCYSIPVKFANAISLDPWGPYVNYHDVARLQYGRLLWKNLVFRKRLLNHWMDPRHPYRDRFIERRDQV